MNVFPAIVVVPVRAAPVFAVHDTVTVVGPPPDPLAGFTLSQDALDPAVQLPEQPAGEPVTATVIAPAAASGLAELELSEYPQAPTPAWFTANVFPAIVTVPALAFAPVFACQLIVSVAGPAPEPLVGLTLSQDASVVAIQFPEQPVGDPVTVAIV